MSDNNGEKRRDDEKDWRKIHISDAVIDEYRIVASLRAKADDWNITGVSNFGGTYIEVTADWPQSGSGELFPGEVLAFMAGNAYGVTWIAEKQEVGYEGSTTVGFSRGEDLADVVEHKIGVEPSWDPDEEDDEGESE